MPEQTAKPFEIPDSISTEPIRLVRTWNIGWDEQGPYLNSLIYADERGKWQENIAMQAKCHRYMGQRRIINTQHKIKLYLRGLGKYRILKILGAILFFPAVIFAIGLTICLALWQKTTQKLGLIRPHKSFAKCCCGLYGHRLDPDYPAHTYHDLKGFLEEYAVLGEIEVWGDVMEGTSGMRGEYAYPKVLHAYGPLQYAVVDLLAKRYQCEMRYHFNSHPDYSSADLIRQNNARWQASFFNAFLGLIFLGVSFALWQLLGPWSLPLAIPALYIGIILMQIAITVQLVYYFVSRYRLDQNYKATTQANREHKDTGYVSIFSHNFFAQAERQMADMDDPMAAYAAQAGIQNTLRS